MSRLVVRRRWMPQGVARIDYGNPLAVGLFALRLQGLLLTSGFGSTNTLYHTKYWHLPGSTSAGVGPNSDAITGFQTGAWTYACVVTPNSTTNRPVMTMAEAPGDGTHDRTLTLDKNGKWMGYTFDGATKVVTSTLSAAAHRTDLLVLSNDGSTMALYVGEERSSTSVSNAGYGSYTTPELVWGRSHNGSLNPTYVSGAVDQIFDGALHFCAVWQRALSHNEVSAWMTNPYGMLL